MKSRISTLQPLPGPGKLDGIVGVPSPHIHVPQRARVPRDRPSNRQHVHFTTAGGRDDRRRQSAEHRLECRGRAERWAADLVGTGPPTQ